MNKLILVTGGARSGKSTFAESLFHNQNSVIYIATGIAFDDEMKERIKKHKASRPKSWITLEAYRDIVCKLQQLADNTQFVLLDCITILLANFIFNKTALNWDKPDPGLLDKLESEISQEIGSFLSFAQQQYKLTVIVTNEVGMGLVPENTMSRYYRDLAGKMNQLIASRVDEVFLMISGVPLKLKG